MILKVVQILRCEPQLRWTTHALILVNGSFKSIMRLKIVLTMLSRKQPRNIYNCLTFSARVYVVWRGVNLDISVCNYFMRNSSKLKRRLLFGS